MANELAGNCMANAHTITILIAVLVGACRFV